MVDSVEAWSAMMDAEKNDQADQRRNKEPNPEIHDQFGHNTLLFVTQHSLSQDPAFRRHRPDQTRRHDDGTA